MASSTDWKSLSKEFQSLDTPEEDMWAELTPFDDKGRALDQWDLRGGPKSRQATFTAVDQAGIYIRRNAAQRERSLQLVGGMDGSIHRLSIYGLPLPHRALHSTSSLI